MNFGRALGVALILFAGAAPAKAANIFLGDSLSACFGKKPDCFPAYFGNARNEPYRLMSYGGAQASDLWWRLHGLNTNRYDRVFYLTGTNDIVQHHLDKAYMPLSEAAFAASVYWLASRRDAVRHSGTETGEWSNSLGGLGRMSTRDGSTWSSRFDGDMLIIGYQLVDGLTSRFSVEVDGKHIGTFSHAPPTTIRTWHEKPPFNGAAPAMLRLTGFGQGPHAVTVTAHGAPGNPSSIEWLWQGPSETDVYVLTVPHMAHSAYRKIGSSDAAIDAYAAAQKSIVAQAQSDGLRVLLVDTNAIVVPDSHLSDGIHLNTAGYRAVVDAIEAAVQRREATSRRYNVSAPPGP